MRSPHDHDLTRGPLLGALVRLATPVVVMQLCHTLYHWIDVMWVGRLGAAATAALTTSFFAVWTVHHGNARIAAIALGHDARAHDLREFKQLLKNAVSWVTSRD